MGFIATAVLAVAAFAIFSIHRNHKDNGALNELYAILTMRGATEHARGNLGESGTLYEMASAIHEGRRLAKLKQGYGSDEVRLTLLRTTDPFFLEKLGYHASNNYTHLDFYGALMRLCNQLESARG